MKTKILKVNLKNPSIKAINEAAEVISSGGLAVFPTDTVYGLGTNAFNCDSKNRIYKIKDRSFDKPLAILVHNLKSAEKLVAPIPREVYDLSENFWPGPLTLIFTPSPVGKIITGGKDSIALRIPDHPVALSILKKAGLPVATTSANPAGLPSSVTGICAKKYLMGKVGVIVDGGRCPGCVESTVVDVRTFPWSIIREGAISRYELMRCAGKVKKRHSRK